MRWAVYYRTSIERTEIVEVPDELAADEAESKELAEVAMRQLAQRDPGFYPPLVATGDDWTFAEYPDDDCEAYDLAAEGIDWTLKVVEVPELAAWTDDAVKVEMPNGAPLVHRIEPETAVNRIRYLLDGREWNVGDLETIADIIRETGLSISEPREEATVDA